MRATVTELWRESLEEKSSEASVRASELKIAGGVRGDNWSEGRLRDRFVSKETREDPFPMVPVRLGYFLISAAVEFVQN
jgi:hypothetical protein